MNKAFIFIQELYCIPILQDHLNEMTCTHYMLVLYVVEGTSNFTKF